MKIKIRDKEYNVSKRVYYHIQGLETEKRLYKMEASCYGRRTIKEIEDKIAEIYKLIQEGKLETARGIIINDALAWTLGEDYLDNPPYVLKEENDVEDK